MKETAPVAVIDLGTHSALLLIAELRENNRLDVLKEDFTITRLGAGIGKEDELLPENQENALTQLIAFQKEIEAFKVGQTVVLATEALRRASNANMFLQRIQDAFGCRVKVLSPQEEAQLTYLGAVSGFDDFAFKLFTVADVGGGSTEISVGRGKKIKNILSFPVGVVRLAEKLNYKEKIVSSDIAGIQEFLDAWFDEYGLKKLMEGAILVGTGGTITTAAAIKQKMEAYDPETIDKTSLTLDELLLMFEDLNAKSLQERRAVPGLEVGREDVIIYGLIIYIHFLQRVGVWRIKVSSRSLRHGYLLSLNENQKDV